MEGFTLVEVMIAVVIFAIVILSIGQALFSGQQATRTVNEDREILRACHALLEDISSFEWGSAGTVGTFEYLEANSPLEFEIDGMGDEKGAIETIDVTQDYPEKDPGLDGKVYHIKITFRGIVLDDYFSKSQM